MRMSNYDIINSLGDWDYINANNNPVIFKKNLYSRANDTVEVWIFNNDNPFTSRFSIKHNNEFLVDLSTDDINDVIQEYRSLMHEDIIHLRDSLWNNMDFRSLPGQLLSFMAYEDKQARLVHRIGPYNFLDIIFTNDSSRIVITWYNTYNAGNECSKETIYNNKIPSNLRELLRNSITKAYSRSSRSIDDDLINKLIISLIGEYGQELIE